MIERPPLPAQRKCSPRSLDQKVGTRDDAVAIAGTPYEDRRCASAEGMVEGQRPCRALPEEAGRVGPRSRG